VNQSAGLAIASPGTQRGGARLPGSHMRGRRVGQCGSPRSAASGDGMSLVSITAFKGINGDELNRLEQGCVLLEPRDGAAIFNQGDPADAVYAIIAGDGCVRVGAIDRRGKALMVEVFRALEIFGEIAVIDGGVRTASAVVEGRVQLMKIRRTAFLATLTRCPALGEALCRMMARRLRRTFELFQDATFETIEVRLARQILYLAEREGRPTQQGLRLAHRFRQADLADLLGTTTRSIITILKAWRAAGLVVYDTDRALLTVQNIAALRAITAVNSEP
jgi:CRP/FNR family cyclic AMP-dependent transcriptional regulator